MNARLRLRVTPIELKQAADIAPAFKRAAALGVNAYVNTQTAIFSAQSQPIADHGLKFKIPGIGSNELSVEAGTFMSYGVSLNDNFRRATAYVDKILKGTKPGDLPIELPTKFELVINRRAAKALGLTVPQQLLLQATEVIE
ncbi:MAG: hypothetical protein A3H91_12420 [Gammaproteobacteria bacterium RIFCSPLOWO2_02_FULL_61_13]|nr:MAG: hypothetical protein A3H91_12420 [Gammaproteobacteria bacterium RIFCSPLOWO2_02_FULL_61_13]